MARREGDSVAAQAISISYNDLSDPSQFERLFPLLDEAFGSGPECLGILLVHNLPSTYTEMRRNALMAASQLANLPEDALKQLTRPKDHYLIGWSHGQEKLAGGMPDTNKGSFYFNPTYEHVESSPNVWPDIDGFQVATTQLAQFIVHVGELVATACDAWATRTVPNYTSTLLTDMLHRSTTCKARLLHYFPTTASTANELICDAWCGEHLDHGCLTGLTSAMYMRDDEELAISPDAKAGLYIKSRSGVTHKVAIPPQSLAFQTGLALQRITSEKLKAVPHLVRGSRVPGVARNTLAVFMQPNLDDTLGASNQTFGDFAKAIVEGNMV